VNRGLKRVLFFIFLGYFLLTLFSFSIERKTTPPWYEAVVVTLTAPVQWTFTSMARGIDHVISRYIWLVDVKDTNERLQTELNQLKAKLVAMQELELENKRLMNILELDLLQPYNNVIAKRIAYGSSRFEQSIRIQKGSNHGITQAAPVVTVSGVVGQTVDVYGRYTNVLLITDPASHIDVMVQRSRTRGLLQGAGTNTLSFELLDRKADIKVGDLVMTSGLDGLYPKGLQVGTVTAVGSAQNSLFMKASVRPAVSFSNLEEVMVMLPLTAFQKQEPEPTP
jgi:rod shape-determining protein MreC